MESPDFWRWIWLIAATTFAIGEMATAGSFFLLPFALGAGSAALLAFLDVNLAIEWGAFVGVSVGVFLALRPLAKRLDRDEPTHGIGSLRLVGEHGVVLEEIPSGGHDLGLVRVHREEWRAESAGGHDLIPAGTRVRVVEVRGTRVIVNPVDQIEPPSPPSPELEPGQHKEP